MAVNPAGYVAITDGGVPRMVTGKAIIGITGGQLCVVSGAADAVSSGLNSFISSDIWITSGASGLNYNGVAIATASSGDYISLATRGIVIVRAGGTIVQGQTVVSNGADDVLTAATAGHVIGRAWSNATSGGYALVELK